MISFLTNEHYYFVTSKNKLYITKLWKYEMTMYYLAIYVCNELVHMSAYSEKKMFCP